MAEDAHAPGPGSRSRGSVPLLPGRPAAGIRALFRNAALAPNAAGDRWPDPDPSRAPVDPGEIRSGGPPRDGLPPIDAPHCVRAGRETGSTWSLSGVAAEGPLAGRRLESLATEAPCAFARLAFNPDPGDPSALMRRQARFPGC